MKMSSAYRVGASTRLQMNQMMVEEIVLDTSAASADTESGGLNVNLVPKDGGNNFRGSFIGEYTNDSLQGSNLTDELRARGLLSANEVQKIYDVGVGFGGPIRQDKLWFFTALRAWGSLENLAGVDTSTQTRRRSPRAPSRPRIRRFRCRLESARLLRPEYEGRRAPANVAGHPEAEDRLQRQRAGLLLVLQLQHQQRGGGVALQGLPEQQLDGHLELPGDQQAVAAGGRVSPAGSSVQRDAGGGRGRAADAGSGDGCRVRLAVRDHHLHRRYRMGRHGKPVPRTRRAPRSPTSPVPTRSSSARRR